MTYEVYPIAELTDQELESKISKLIEKKLNFKYVYVEYTDEFLKVKMIETDNIIQYFRDTYTHYVYSQTNDDLGEIYFHNVKDETIETASF